MDDKSSIAPNPRHYCEAAEKFLRRYPNDRFNYHTLNRSLGYKSIDYYYWHGLITKTYGEKHTFTPHATGRVFYEFLDGELAVFFSKRWYGSRPSSAKPLDPNKPADSDLAQKIQGWRMRYPGHEELKRAWHEKIQGEKYGNRLHPLGSFSKHERQKIVEFFREVFPVDAKEMTADELNRVAAGTVQAADALQTYTDNVLLILKNAGLFPHHYDYEAVKAILKETGQLEGTFVAENKPLEFTNRFSRANDVLHQKDVGDALEKVGKIKTTPWVTDPDFVPDQSTADKMRGKKGEVDGQ